MKFLRKEAGEPDTNSMGNPWLVNRLTRILAFFMAYELINPYINQAGGIDMV